MTLENFLAHCTNDVHVVLAVFDPDSIDIHVLEHLPKGATSLSIKVDRKYLTARIVSVDAIKYSGSLLVMIEKPEDKDVR